MGSELEVEWFNPTLFPNAPDEHKGGWVPVFAGDKEDERIAIQMFRELALEGKVARITWRPL